MGNLLALKKLGKNHFISNNFYLAALTLKEMNKINALHNENNLSIRMRAIDSLSAEELYFMMVMGESAFVRLPVVLILLVVGKEGLFVEIRARRGSESFLLIIKGLRVDVVLNSADDVLIIFYMMVIFGSMSFSSCGQGIHIFIQDLNT